jgi:hypothetical protein
MGETRDERAEKEGGKEGGREGGREAVEGGPLVRSSSVLGQEDEILDGVVEAWEGLREGGMEEVVRRVKEGWGKGTPRKLMALRRLLLGLRAVAEQAREVGGLVEEEVEGREGSQEEEEGMRLSPPLPAEVAPGEAGVKEAGEEQEEGWMEAAVAEMHVKEKTPVGTEGAGSEEAGEDASGEGGEEGMPEGVGGREGQVGEGEGLTDEHEEEEREGKEGEEEENMAVEEEEEKGGETMAGAAEAGMEEEREGEREEEGRIEVQREGGGGGGKMLLHGLSISPRHCRPSSLLSSSE